MHVSCECMWNGVPYLLTGDCAACFTPAHFAMFCSSCKATCVSCSAVSRCAVMLVASLRATALSGWRCHLVQLRRVTARVLGCRRCWRAGGACAGGARSGAGGCLLRRGRLLRPGGGCARCLACMGCSAGFHAWVHDVAAMCSGKHWTRSHCVTLAGWLCRRHITGSSAG